MGREWLVEVAALDDLFAELRRRGYTVVGPRVGDGAIVLDELGSWRDLPVGVGEDQEAGTYRLRRRGDAALFGYASGPQSWKRLLFPPRQPVWKIRLDGEGSFRPSTGGSLPDAGPPRYAFVGVRPCDLQAVAVQDRVFLGGDHQDPAYASRRRPAFVVAVNCAEPGGTCFCASMGTGPSASTGFDLALTEVAGEERHFLLAEVGTAEGEEVLAACAPRPATEAEVDEGRSVLERSRARMGRMLDTDGLPGMLAESLEHPRWDEVAGRCLGCANCTMVCPTCFCSTVEDVTDVTGEHAERWRRWDSCFTVDFSYLHGGSVRTSTRSRYRQWLTHKLGTWHDQFGTSGCVGCGRCITWCPVGIDLTVEVAALRGGVR